MVYANVRTTYAPLKYKGYFERRPYLSGKVLAS